MPSEKLKQNVITTTTVGDDQLERLGAAWEAFIVAVRRARARTGERETGLSLSQYEFLRPLWSSDGLPVTQLAERFGIAPATATGILDGLARSGIIERTRAAADRRTVTITLTDEGRRRVARKRRSIARQRRRLFESLAPEERAHTERLLRHLAQVIAEI
jgi:MarR family transcriptional regulator, organic hydroperoxide resistance regulator